MGKRGPPPGYKPSPQSLANLTPWKPGQKPQGAGGETVSHALKDILREFKRGEPHNARLIAEKMVERAKILTGKSDAAILNQLLDRTEGKVREETLPQNINVVFVIGKGYQETTPRLTERLIEVIPIEVKHDATK